MMDETGKDDLVSTISSRCDTEYQEANKTAARALKPEAAPFATPLEDLDNSAHKKDFASEVEAEEISGSTPQCLDEDIGGFSVAMEKAEFDRIAKDVTHTTNIVKDNELEIVDVDDDGEGEIDVNEMAIESSDLEPGENEPQENTTVAGPESESLSSTENLETRNDSPELVRCGSPDIAENFGLQTEDDDRTASSSEVVCDSPASARSASDLRVVADEEEDDLALTDEERRDSNVEHFYEVAAARIAELTPEAKDDRGDDGVESYAEDTPTPRLVVIAENIDSVGGGRNELAGESELRPESVDENDQTEAKTDDSGVNDLSSTGATTPEESCIFSPPPTQPAASLSSAMLDRKQSALESKTNPPSSSFVKSQPLLTVRCTNAAVDGDSIRFALHSTRGATEQEFVVDRSFEDFEWLHECMTTTNDFPGLIFPPLPKKPNAELLLAESERKIRRGSTLSRTSSTSSSDGLPSLVMSRQRRLPADCRAFETYLNLLLAHQVIADDSTLVKFVTEPQAVPRVRLKKGLLFKLSFAIDTSFNSSRESYPDSDNYFQQERNWLLGYLPRLTQAAVDCGKLIDAEMKISRAYDHLSTTLSLLITAPNGDQRIAMYNNMLAKLRRSTDALAEINESVCFKDEDSLSSTLNVFAKYMEASRDMLYKRIGLLVDYNEAVNKVTQAKPSKKKTAENAMVSAEKAFADCTVVAKKELRHFRGVRIAEMKKSLVAMATAKRDEAQRAYDALSDIHASVAAL